MKDTFPVTVYKYRRWNNEYDKRVLTHKELFFASPRDFKDQEDCSQTVNYSALTDKEKFDWAVEVTKNNYRSMSPNIIPEVARRFLKRSPINNPVECKKLQEEQLERYFDITGVLSLTFNSNSDKMWEDYGDNHQGFCIGFDSKLLFESKIAGKGGYVDYVEELPKIYPEPKMDFLTQAKLQIFSKLKKWEFEEEYRLHIIRGKNIEIADRRKYPPSSAFKEIIIGENMPEEDLEELKSSIPDVLKHVEIIRL